MSKMFTGEKLKYSYNSGVKDERFYRRYSRIYTYTSSSQG